MRYVPSICRSFHWIAVPHCSINPSRPCASEACLWRLAVVSSMGVFLRMPDAGKGHSVCRQHRQKTASIRLSTSGPLCSPSMILGCLFAPPSILCRCRNGAALQQAPVQARERRAGSRELFEPSSSTAQTFVLVSGPAIDDRLFFKKPVPARAPAGKGGEPLRCALASCRMPAYDMVFCAGDKHHDVAAKPYSVDEHDAVRFAACRHHGSEFPEPRSETPEGSRRHPHLGLGPLRQKPVQERLEKLCCVVDAVRRGRLARHALPAFGTR